MNGALLWRTARHLSTEQIAYLLIRRLRHASRRWRPHRAHARVTAAAADLPELDPASPVVTAIARQVLALQATVHATDCEVERGSFFFLGRSVDFGSLESIEWRRHLDEESSPLWRLTLAYFGWAVVLVERGDSDALRLVATAVQSLERSSDWSAPGIFRDLWNPYTASHRLINLIAVLNLYRPKARTDIDAERTILHHVRFCAAHIAADLEKDLQFNHLLKNYVALAVFASAARAFPSTLDFLRDAVPRAIRQVFLADGGHAERSPMYHALGLLDLKLLRTSGLFRSEWGPELDRHIAAAESALACLTHPDGDIALFNDSWLGAAPSPVSLGAPGPPAGRHDLAASGYGRLGAGKDCVIFDCGPIGPDSNPAHGHADHLAIEASVSGRRFIVDFGTPTYATGEQRDLSRAAASHNGPRVQGVEPVEFWKSFRVGKRSRAGFINDPGLACAPLWIAGWHDGYANLGIDVRRWIGLWPGQGFVVADLWLGDKEGRGASDFLIATPWRSAVPDDFLFHGPVAVRAVPLAGRLEDGGPSQWWPRYGEASSATRIRLTPDGHGLGAAAFLWGHSPPADLDETLGRVRPILAAVQGSTGRAH